MTMYSNNDPLPKRLVKGSRDSTTYADILDKFNLAYKSTEYYWQIGTAGPIQNWIINLSVIKIQLPQLLEVIIPVLVDFNFPFRIIRDENTAEYALNGSLGPRYLGKMIVVYPPTPQDALTIAKTLINLTKSFKGPAIRTDRHLGGVVYTNFGTHTTVPFSQPLHTIWPFTEIAKVEIPDKPKLLNLAYYPIGVIKADAKGDVIKALYFKKIWKIKSCIIKQGRENMLMDSAGRDICNRLQWQYELYNELGSDLPLPKIFDHFMINKDSYLAMEYIHGRSLTHHLDKLYDNRIWPDLTQDEQTKVLDHFLNILHIVQLLHRKGYVHRDITPENFLLDKYSKIWLIDVELMWSIHSGQPAPPYTLGTPGFMSPEQKKISIPTDKEDIYSLGAVLLSFLTNLAPIKFQQLSGSLLRKNINFFVQNDSISSLISESFHDRPTERPILTSIASAVKSFRQKVETNTKLLYTSSKTINSHLDYAKLRNTIQLALNGLTAPSATDPDNRWLSRMPADSKEIGNEQLGMTVQEGWYRGVAGPLWLLATARSLGFDINQCMTAYNLNWIHIQEQYFHKNSSNKTFYEGGAGIALALTEGLNSGLLPLNDYHLQCLKQCFSKDSALPTLAEGVAGQGLGLLYSSHWLQPSYTEDLLAYYINRLIADQDGNGTWQLPDSVNTNIYGLNHGIAGIIWFLLAFLQKHSNSKARTTTIKALNWLIRNATKKGKGYTWLDSKNDNPWSLENGQPGIALVLLKASSILKMDIYCEMAEKLLCTIPEHPVIANFTLGSGLSGIGELHLEAFQILNDTKWQTRAEWIAQLLLHTLHVESSNEAIWLPDHQSDFTSNLFMGNSGIIHFLMRCMAPEKLTHPFDPFHNTKK